MVRNCKTKDAVAVLSTTTDADATNNFVTYQDNMTLQKQYWTMPDT